RSTAARSVWELLLSPEEEVAYLERRHPARARFDRARRVRAELVLDALLLRAREDRGAVEPGVVEDRAQDLAVGHFAIVGPCSAVDGGARAGLDEDRAARVDRADREDR